MLSRYEQNQLLFNANHKGKTSLADSEAYRGDLVLEEGEIADAQGRRKPPLSVVKQAVLLSKADKLIFVSGFLEKIEALTIFGSKYAADLADEAMLIFFVENIAKPIRVTYQGISYVMIPLLEGENTVWNELLELLGLEKGDFKGQSAEDKVVTVYNAVQQEFKPNYPELSYEAALAQTITVKKEARVGAV